MVNWKKQREALIKGCEEGLFRLSEERKRELLHLIDEKEAQEYSYVEIKKREECPYYLDGQCAYWSAKKKLPKCDKNTPFCNKNFKRRRG